MTTGYLIVFTALTVAAAGLAWRRRSWLVFAGLAAFALWPAGQLLERMSWWLLVPVALIAAGVAWHRFSRTSATVTRWGARTRRKAGVASTLDVARVGSGVAMRRKAATVRPSLSCSTRRRRWRQLLLLPTAEVAVQLCRVGLLRVWISVEDVLVVFGGPRTGKTQYLAGRIIDAPGAVLVTSTRTDLYETTAPLRYQRGPVYVFNAVGLAGLPSTITFDPLTGCADPVTAHERAADMLGAVSAAGGAGGSGEREFWDAQGRRVLAALLHAAALGGLSMRDVHSWVADPDGAQARIGSLLRKSPERAFEVDVAQFVGTNTRTRTSITSTVMPALGWLAHPAAAAAAQPSRFPFDVADLIASRATVYLLGGEEAQSAPLVCALTGHIARQARALAALQPGGRLDPALTLALDEAALISPVPLQRWTADMGGRGVTIVAAFQSRAQLLARYGDADAAVILNNAAAALLFGGTRDRDDLQFWSTLAGDRDEPVLSTDVHGGRATRTVRKVPVLAPAQLANLPAGRVVAFRRGMPPVIGRPEQAHRRRDVRTLHGHRDPAWRRLLTRLGRPVARQLARLRPPVPVTGLLTRPGGLPVDDPWVIPTEWTGTPGTTGPAGDTDPRDNEGVVVMARREDSPSIAEVAALTARLRHLRNLEATEAERAAFLADKDALIARIADSVPAAPSPADRVSTGRPDTDEARDEAAVAARAAAGGYAQVGPSARIWSVDPTTGIPTGPVPEAEHRMVRDLIARERLDCAEPVWLDCADGGQEIVAALLPTDDATEEVSPAGRVDDGWFTDGLDAAHTAHLDALGHIDTLLDETFADVDGRLLPPLPEGSLPAVMLDGIEERLTGPATWDDPAVLDARLAALRATQAAAGGTPVGGWPSVRAEAAARELAARGTDLDTARGMVDDYSRETSELTKVAPDEWGLDQGDIDAMAARQHLPTSDGWDDSASTTTAASAAVAQAHDALTVLTDPAGNERRSGDDVQAAELAGWGRRDEDAAADGDGWSR